jgi:hypothetical protein
MDRHDHSMLAGTLWGDAPAPDERQLVERLLGVGLLDLEAAGG